jgi:hypothetical protein
VQSLWQRVGSNGELDNYEQKSEDGERAVLLTRILLIKNRANRPLSTFI